MILFITVWLLIGFISSIVINKIMSNEVTLDDIVSGFLFSFFGILMTIVFFVLVIEKYCVKFRAYYKTNMFMNLKNWYSINKNKKLF